MISGLAFAPDGRTLAAARDDGTIVLSDLTDRDRPHQLGQPLTGHTGAVSAVAFAPDGRTLATAGVDRTVRLWSMSDRNLPIPVGQPLTGHTDSVHTVAFAPDGRTLVTAGGGPDRAAVGSLPPRRDPQISRPRSLHSRRWSP